MNSIKPSGDRPSAPATKPQRFTVPAEYRPLHKYLLERFADTVVLRFAEIEALLGIALPAVARTDPGWWATVDDAGAPVTQSHAWTQANRTAVANLRAQSVMFERAPA
jgi:hypothetical protein